jgi:hypothetical protein
VHTAQLAKHCDISVHSCERSVPGRAGPGRAGAVFAEAAFRTAVYLVCRDKLAGPPRSREWVLLAAVVVVAATQASLCCISAVGPAYSAGICAAVLLRVPAYSESTPGQVLSGIGGAAASPAPIKVIE